MKKVTLSVGIPAYNEEKNIGNLLKTIIDQKQLSYKIESVYVICDGCTDKTVEIVEGFSKKHNFVKAIEKNDRGGKASASNMIYRLNKSDYILTIDADMIFAKDDDIESMIREITKDINLNFVGPRHCPIPAKSFMGKLAVVSYLSFEDAYLKLNGGNNFYAVMGAYLLTKKFAKTIKYPAGAQADQSILYAWATRKNKNGFNLIKEANVLFRTVTTFRDWRILGVRSVISDKANTAKFFGEEILKEYYMPRRLFIASLLKWFFKSPFYMTGSIIMNIYIRKFPLKEKMPVGGIWEMTQSSKEAITI